MYAPTLSTLLFCLFLAPATAQKTVYAYNFDQPELIAELPDELEEISGLSIAPGTADELLAVQDELGKVYRLNATGHLLWSIDFWKDGDYEGIEAVGDEIWVVKNTGTLYQIADPGEATQHVTKYNTALTSDNDVEGLAYDKRQNRLLLACKRDARDDGNAKDGRYIFAFDLATKTLSEDPVYAISRTAVNRFLAEVTGISGRDELEAFFSEGENYELAPSALAIHPLSGNLYLTSSVGKLLMVLSPAGEILELHRLDKRYFAQPEGLAFRADGTLFVSTEAKGKARARVFRLPVVAR